jgi:hypothetical protein
MKLGINVAPVEATSQDSSVIALTRPWAEQVRSQGLIPGRRRKFLFSPLHPDHVWGTKLTTHYHLVLRGMYGTIPPLFMF